MSVIALLISSEHLYLNVHPALFELLTIALVRKFNHNTLIPVQEDPEQNVSVLEHERK